MWLVGASRFERPTPCAQGRCAIQAALRPDMIFITIIQWERQQIDAGYRMPDAG
jgi:hypothetical protein